MSDLFPETLNLTRSAKASHQQGLVWEGPSLCKWGQPRATVKLLPLWSTHHGWRCGWLVHIDRSLDEWNPIAPNAWKQHSGYPWHRPESMPQSDKQSFALAAAAFEVRLVIAQMLTYTEPELHAEVAAISWAIDAQRRVWQTS